jgi:hypothetical protein
MINFYRRFIPRAAETLQPLNDLLKGLKKSNALIEWSARCENAFCESKRALANATMLAHPVPGAPISLRGRRIELRDRSRAATMGEQRMATVRIPNEIFNYGTTEI